MNGEEKIKEKFLKKKKTIKEKIIKKRVIKKRVIKKRVIKDNNRTKKRYRIIIPDEIRSWIIEHYQISLNCYTKKIKIYNQYSKFCQSNNILVRGKNILGKYLKQIFPNVETYIYKFDDKVYPFYYGIQKKQNMIDKNTIISDPEINLDNEQNQNKNLRKFIYGLCRSCAVSPIIPSFENF